jgi:prophage regulatory protein
MEVPMDKKIRFMRLKEVLKVVPFGHTILYERVNEGLFPKQIHIGPKMVAWDESEVQEVMAAYKAEQTDDEIKALVRGLLAKRKPPARYNPIKSPFVLDLVSRIEKIWSQLKSGVESSNLSWDEDGLYMKRIDIRSLGSSVQQEMSRISKSIHGLKPDAAVETK